MAHTRRPLIFLLGLIASVSPVFAQKVPTPAPPATFRVMALTDNVPASGLFYLKTSKDGLPIIINKNRLSSPLPANSTTLPLIFGTKTQDTQGAMVYKTVVQAAWPDSTASEALVFFAVSGVGASATVNALAVDNSPTAFPRRTLRVINFSGQKIFGQFGSFKGELPAGASRAVAYPEVQAPRGGVGRFQLGLGILSPDGNTELIFSGWTEAWPSARTLVLISPSTAPGSDRPKVRFLVDDLTPPIPAQNRTR